MANGRRVSVIGVNKVQHSFGMAKNFDFYFLLWFSIRTLGKGTYIHISKFNYRNVRVIDAGSFQTFIKYVLGSARSGKKKIVHEANDWFGDWNWMPLGNCCRSKSKSNKVRTRTTDDVNCDFVLSIEHSTAMFFSIISLRKGQSFR